MAEKVKMLERYMENNRLEKENKSYLERIADSFRGFTRKVPVYVGIGAMLFGASTGLIGCGRSEEYHTRPPTQIKQEQLQLEEQVQLEDKANPAAIAHKSTELEGKVNEEQEYKGKIAFVSDRDGNDEIYMMNSDGSNQQILTSKIYKQSKHYATRDDEHYIIEDLSWSPDGRKIAFILIKLSEYCDTDNHYEIYIMDYDGKNLKLTGEGDFPSWSPDGSKIVFSSYRDENNEIYISNSDGTNQRNITARPEEDYFPLWSPDGSKIAFVSNGDGNTEIYIMNPDGTEQKNLTRNPGPDSSASWSPDGKWIAFDSISEDINNDGRIDDIDVALYKISSDGKNKIKIADCSGTFPSWSPDGSKLAFSSRYNWYINANEEIYVVNSDGSEQRSLTNNPAFDGGPSWSPDGKKIVFVSERDGNWEIYVTNADGSGQRNLTNNPGNDMSPVWFPDGREILYDLD